MPKQPRGGLFSRRRGASSAKVDPLIVSPSREGVQTAPAATPKCCEEHFPQAPERSPERSSSAPARSRKKTYPGSFKLENALDGPTAEEVDEYISSVLGGGSIAADLRSATWGDRLRGIEMLQARVEAKGAAPVAEREALFKICVSVLARLLHDKIVPVYLPALHLLQVLYSSEAFLRLLEPLVRDAAAILVPPLVLRSGSSNVRAKEESNSVLSSLAASPYVGASAVCPHTLRPLSNNKAVAAAAGRLELLHGLVIRFGFGSVSGLPLEAVLGFVLPFHEEANDRTREAARAIVREALTAQAEETVAYLRSKHPELAKALAVRAGLEEEEKKPAHQPFNPRILPPIRKISADDDSPRMFSATAGLSKSLPAVPPKPAPRRSMPSKISVIGDDKEKENSRLTATLVEVIA